MYQLSLSILKFLDYNSQSHLIKLYLVLMDFLSNYIKVPSQFQSQVIAIYLVLINFLLSCFSSATLDDLQCNLEDISTLDHLQNLSACQDFFLNWIKHRRLVDSFPMLRKSLKNA